MAKSVIEVLTEARAKVAQGWCQKAIAEDANGEITDCEHKSACKWCAFGSLLAVTDEWCKAFDLLNKLAPGKRGFINFNDDPGRTQAEVVALFDAAIAKAREPKTTEEVSRG